MTVDGVDVAGLLLRIRRRIGVLLLGVVVDGRSDVVDAGRRVEWAALFVEMCIGKICSLRGVEVLYLVL